MQSNSANENDVDRKLLRLAWEACQEADYATALKEFSELADKGYALAWLHLGWLHNAGLGVPQNYSKAESCYNHAIALGNVEALVLLGKLYYGNGAAEKAFDFFLRAANHEYIPGIYWTGRAYLRGHGTNKDIEKAKKYLTTASGRGHVYARMDFCGAQIRGVYGGVQRIAGVLRLPKAVVVMAKALRYDPHGDRVR